VKPWDLWVSHRGVEPYWGSVEIPVRPHAVAAFPGCAARPWAV